tara:strand:+ start:157 stop:390 length:234 start_codon:yes stop_codon:yes gene_type:complete
MLQVRARSLTLSNVPLRLRALPLHLETMGLIADALNRDYDAMRARHAQRGLELAELYKSAHDLIKESKKLPDENRAD